MLVQSILTLINDLKKFTSLLPYEIDLLNAITDLVKGRAADESLKTIDFQMLIHCFKTRWENIANEDDYMVNTKGVNQRWIAFAIELAPFTNKNYLQILLPTVTNTVDYNNLTSLTETVRLQNFYLGSGNRVLYRKRGLCEHLIEHHYVLSTCRELNTRKLYPMTIEELSRLHACKQTDGQFSIGDEEFADFWGFLRKKVITRLQFQGEMPVDLLPHLLLLIERYYELKESRTGYDRFKQYLDDFFKGIYEHKLNDVNYFYGIEIPYKGKVFTALDFLIVLHDADGYVLDEHLKAMMEWLYNYHPALKVSHKDMSSFYSSLKKPDHSEQDGPVDVQENYLEQCLRFLLSLFTFGYVPFTVKKINFWDVSRPIFTDASDLYKGFEPLLVENKVSELGAQYQQVREEYIIPGNMDISLYTWLTRSSAISDWYNHVEANRWDQLGVHWFDPELIMHVLLHYKTPDVQLHQSVHKLLDELVHTYAQDNPELHKQLRVNILFADFIKEQHPHIQKYVLLSMQIQDKLKVKANFLSNCTQHIMNRLSDISMVNKTGTLHFFNGIRRIDMSKILVSDIQYDHVNSIIEAFKLQLRSRDSVIEEGLLEKMTTYLRDISRPILTIREHEEAKNSAYAMDYLGAST